MLGGAGPAIAAVPLTAIWVGGSVVTVATSLATAQLGPVAATQRVGYVALASLSQARHLRWNDVPCLLLAHGTCCVACDIWTAVQNCIRCCAVPMPCDDHIYHLCITVHRDVCFVSQRTMLA